MLMKSLADPTPLFGGDAPSDHVVLHPTKTIFEEVFMLMQSSTNPTLLLESIMSTKVVTPMKSSADTTLLSESVESAKVVMSMQYFTDPTPLMGSDVSTYYFFIISSSVLSKQGGIPLTSSTPPPSPRMFSFDWNDLVEPWTPYFSPFQIRVELIQKTFTIVLWMKDPLQVFYPPQLGKLWVLLSLCLLRMSCWILKYVLVNIWGFFLSFLSR
jgi:hypothetical protein